MSVVYPGLAPSTFGNQNLSPHALGSALMDSALERAEQAIKALERDDRSEAIHFSRVLTALISSLQNTLDPPLEGDVSDNLNALYDYMIIRLSGAGEAGNESAFAEVHALLGQIKQGWENFIFPADH